MNRNRVFPLTMIIGSIIVCIGAVSLFGKAAEVSRAQASNTAQGEAFVYTTTLGYNWAYGHVGPITSTQEVISSLNQLIVEIRKPDGTVLGTRAGSLPGCEPIYTVPGDEPEFPSGWCDGLLTFEFVLPYSTPAPILTPTPTATSKLEEWGKGAFLLAFADGTSGWYDVPVAGAIEGPDEQGFYLIDLVEEPTPTPTLTPTSTDTPTSTPTGTSTSTDTPTATGTPTLIDTPTATWTPTGIPVTDTPVPTETPEPRPDLAVYFRRLAEEYRGLAALLELAASALEQ